MHLALAVASVAGGVEPQGFYAGWIVWWTILFVLGAAFGTLAGKNALSFMDFLTSYFVVFCLTVMLYAGAAFYIRMVTGQIEKADAATLLFYGVAILSFVGSFLFTFFSFFSLDERT